MDFFLVGTYVVLSDLVAHKDSAKYPVMVNDILEADGGVSEVGGVDF